MSEFYDFDYFMQQCWEFREAFGTKQFWRLPLQNRRGAILGLSRCAMRCSGDNDEISIMLSCHIQEYLIRASYMRVEP